MNEAAPADASPADPPAVDELLTLRVRGSRRLVHVRERARDDQGRAVLFVSGDPAALPHLDGLRVATRDGERLELRETRLVAPPTEPGERPGAAEAALVLGCPIADQAGPIQSRPDGSRSTPRLR